MNEQVEKLEKSQVKFSLNITPEELEEGVKYAYNKEKSRFSLPGFRKGKAPRQLIEKQYGVEVFFDDAVNYAINKSYPATIKEMGLKVVSRAEFDIVSISKKDGAELTVIVTVKPEVILGQYKGLSFKSQPIEATEDEIMAEINKVREKNSRLITVQDRPSQMGDMITIDFEGFIDGVAFEGGKGEDYSLELGSGTFIDNFEEQLTNRSVGDDLEVNVTFPENYNSEELAGKPAVFKVEVKDIQFKELPEINDEFAQDASEFDNLDEYKNSIRETIIHEKEHQASHKVEDELLTLASSNATLEVPEIMVEKHIDGMLQEFEYRTKMQGMTFEMFLQYSGQTLQQFRDSCRESAMFSVKARLVLEEIAKAENLQADDDEIKQELSRIAESYGISEDKMEQLFSIEDREDVVNDIVTRKALEIIKSTAVEIVE